MSIFGLFIPLIASLFACLVWIAVDDYRIGKKQQTDFNARGKK